MESQSKPTMIMPMQENRKLTVDKIFNINCTIAKWFRLLIVRVEQKVAKDSDGSSDTDNGDQTQ